MLEFLFGKKVKNPPKDVRLNEVYKKFHFISLFFFGIIKYKRFIKYEKNNINHYNISFHCRLY